MDPYIVVLAGFGVVVLLTAWLPMLLKELPLSLPIFCVALGATIFALPNVPGVAPHPQDHLKLTERLTELAVIVALMGAGLKLDRPLAWATCQLTWRLLGIAMPLTIAALAILGTWLLGLGAAAAILLAASLAPTDPVLASEVQVGPPGGGKEDEVRFTLTAEAGLNDGLAFPFVNLGVALALASQTGEPWLGQWIALDVVWKLSIGIIVGWLVGRTLGWLTFRLPNRAELSRTGDGFVALGITAVSYGLTEMVLGYGFLAVFVSAIAFRSVERNHAYHEKLHDFTEQLERLLMMILLVIFGGAITSGGLFETLSWSVVLFALLTIFLIRPIVGWISLAGSSQSNDEKAVIAFFGIRGLGSAYYLAYGLGHAPFEAPHLLWSAIGLVVLISVVLHGATVTPTMRYLDRRRQRYAVGNPGKTDRDLNVELRSCPRFVRGIDQRRNAAECDPMRIANQERKTLILSGASRGIGHATVKRFSSAGWRVISCSRHPFPEDCPWEMGAEDHIQVDLADPTDTARAIALMKENLAGQGGRLNALVNNAAISPKGPNGKRVGAIDTSLDDWKWVFQVNFFAPIMLARGLMEELKAAKGAVVNVSSIAGSRVHPFAGAAYATSKAALMALTREMAHDFGPHGIRVNSISPGEIDTSILSPGTEKIVKEQIPMGRVGEPEEVAEAIYFLCSDASSYVNGTELHINGGQHV